jgi:hypothetical protein
MTQWEHPVVVAVRRAECWLTQRGVTSERRVFVAGAALSVMIGLWLTSGAWGGRLPATDDFVAHVIRADFSGHLLAHGHLDGWHPRFMVGYQAFLFFGPGLSWVVVALRLVTFGGLSTVGALKVVAVAGIALLPLAVAFAARSFGLDRRAAGVAAILSLAVSNPFGVGIQAVFTIGFLPNQVGAILFFVCLGCLVRALSSTRSTWVVAGSVSFAALVVTHLPSVAVLAVVMVVITALSLPFPSGNGVQPGALTRVTLTAIAGAALAAPVLVPLLAHRDLHGIFSGWGHPPLGERFTQIVRGQIVYRPYVGALVLIGLAYWLLAGARRKPLALALVGCSTMYLFIAHGLHHVMPGNLVVDQLPNRGLGFAGILGILPLAALLAWLARGGTLLEDITVLGVAALLVIVPGGNTRAHARQSRRPARAMYAAAAELGRVVPAGARFATQRDFPAELTRTHIVHPDMWLAWMSGRDTLNIFNAESSASPAGFESEHLLDRAPDVVAHAFSRLGVTHVVTVADAAVDQLTQSTRFSILWRDSPLTILSVAPDVGQPDPSDLLTAEPSASARLVQFQPERVHIVATVPQQTSAQVAIGWSPKWHARVNGRRVPLARTREGLLEVRLPAGTSRLTLEFRRDLWDGLGVAIGFLAAVLLLREVRRRQVMSKSFSRTA